MKPSFIVSVLMMSLLAGCGSYTISKESFTTQLKSNQEPSRVWNFNSLGTGYYSNNLDKIQCVDKNGQNVWLYAGKNMNFKITKASDQKTVTMYFDTVILQNDTVYGLVSRIVGGKRQIPLNDVDKIAIHVENPKVEVIK